MQLIIYDTEFTAWPGSVKRRWSASWEHKEIIQFSAHKLRICASKIETLQIYNRFVQPKLNPILSDYICALTQIRQSDINQGIDTPTLFSELSQLTEQGRIAMLSWGNDWHVLDETATINDIAITHLQSHDLRPVFQHFKIPTNCSSGQLYRHFALPLTITEHNAEQDTVSLVESLRCLHRQNPEKLLRGLRRLIHA